jgi:hypothetical protein
VALRDEIEYKVFERVENTTLLRHSGSGKEQILAGDDSPHRPGRTGWSVSVPTDPDGFPAFVNLEVTLQKGGLLITGDLEMTAAEAQSLAAELVRAADLRTPSDVDAYHDDAAEAVAALAANPRSNLRL